MNDPITIRACQCCGLTFAHLSRCGWCGGRVVVTDTDPMLGMQLGSWVLHEVIGAGGMAKVYEARHVERPELRAAIKIPLGEQVSSAERDARFVREIGLAALVESEHVVALRDCGRTGEGVPYAVMELLEGSTLEELLDDGPLPLDEVVKAAVHITRGLAAIHAKGAVLRDLKPSNVIRVRAGYKLVDFGIARDGRAGAVRLTATNVILGAAIFTPPEVLLGGESTERSDLYQLGVVLFMMVTGLHPYWRVEDGDDATPAQMRQLSREPTAAIDTEPELRALIEALLAVDPARRTGSTAEVLAALDALASRLSAERVVRSAAARTHRVDWLGASALLTAVITSAVIGAVAMAVFAASEPAPGPAPAPAAVPARVRLLPVPDPVVLPPVVVSLDPPPPPPPSPATERKAIVPPSRPKPAPVPVQKKPAIQTPEPPRELDAASFSAFAVEAEKQVRRFEARRPPPPALDQLRFVLASVQHVAAMSPFPVARAQALRDKWNALAQTGGEP